MDGLDWSVWTGLLPLVIVLVIISPLVYAVTRWYGFRVRRNSTMIIKESLPLGSTRGLLVVEWEGERILLGVTPQSIRVLRRHDRTSDREAEEVGP